MKELTIEEKAKAYDEAIKKAQDAVDKSMISQNFISDIFPRLKEFEDEKIRKFTIHIIQHHTSEQISSKDKQKCIAWLEKQGTTNETINTDEFTQGVLKGAAINLITWIDYNVAKGNMCLSNIECKDIEDALVSGDWDKIYAYIKKKLEKQDEKPQGKPALEVINKEKVDNKNCVKSTDRIEPKFHENA